MRVGRGSGVTVAGTWQCRKMNCLSAPALTVKRSGPKERARVLAEGRRTGAGTPSPKSSMRGELEDSEPSKLRRSILAVKESSVVVSRGLVTSCGNRRESTYTRHHIWVALVNEKLHSVPGSQFARIAALL